MDSRAWLAHLEQFGIKLGLDTIRAIASELDHPERAFPLLHVAGTNGKGSVSAMTSRALTAGGLRTGCYTSPHLVRFEERFAIDGRPASKAALDAALAEVNAAVRHLQAEGVLGVDPTYFEATTAAAFVVFRSAPVDCAVIEVGLGGRFDATNIVTPLVTAITSIDFDHQEHLGGTLAAIAAEKAGTIKPEVPVVVGRMPDDARTEIRRAADRHAAPLVDAHADTRLVAQSRGGRYEVTLDTPVARYGPLLLALAGRHQVDNAVVAVRLLETASENGLPIPHDAIVAGLTRVRWPARLETLDTPRGRLIVDGAHNPAGARALTSYLQDTHPAGLPLVVGVMRDKDHQGMLAALLPVARPLILTRAPGERAASPQELADALGPSSTAALVEPDLDAALALAWSHGEVIAVAGSLYLAGAVLSLVGAPTE
jgi:dihydrofolate synthase / folylpolyglutamate synthase